MFHSCGNMCWILKGWHFHASSEGTEEQCHWWSLRMDATRGAFKNSLYQEIKQFSPLWKHWGCQQRKLNWNSGVSGTRRVSRLVWPWASLSLSLGFSQASLQLTEPDVMGGFQLCPCPWRSQVTAATGLRIRWLKPHSPSATGRCLVHESTTAGEQQPHVAQGSPERLSELKLLKKRAVPLPMDHWVPSCMGLQEWYLRMKPPSKKAGGRWKEQDAGCSHCRTYLQLCLKLILCLDFLLGAPVICKQYHRDKYRGPWGWGGTRRGGRWGKGRTEGQRLRREKGCKLRETDSPVIWLTYWVYI